MAALKSLLLKILVSLLALTTLVLAVPDVNTVKPWSKAIDYKANTRQKRASGCEPVVFKDKAGRITEIVDRCT